ncbi:major facilitator superfamily domain-containing protein 6-A-like [Pollicipes pollicipes]|uniref:major facilitator superfamily domain-containing protein 6-A-like n=1 Tax=Pollicipes pollicipes TaxID=41117 RepID=UPI0018849C2E|nr:major facilitator superfamily domain-containing protein 6-A-like [Pollicipes pollicipes]
MCAINACGVSILPLMTLHMTDLGLTYADVAQVYVFMPVASFLGPPCQPSAGLPASSRTTFWVYFALRMVGVFFMAPSFTLLDATNLALVRQHKTPGQNFGRQRVTAIAATIIVPPLVGVIIDLVSTPAMPRSICLSGLKSFTFVGICITCAQRPLAMFLPCTDVLSTWLIPGKTNYGPAFYSMDLFVVFTVVTLYACNLKVALPEKAHFRQVTKILKRPETLVFILAVALLGSMWGFLENFLFVFLKSLQAPTYLMGLTMTVAGLASLPFNWWSDAICRKVGHINVLLVSFAGYTLRYIGYSFIRNPWLCFPFELLEVVTTHLMWNSAATYAGQLAPPGLLATLTGLAGALHYSFGRGVGSFIGGYLMALSGPAFTFRTMGIGSGVAGALYAIVYYGCLRQRISQREERQRAKKTQQNADPMEDPHELAAMLEEHAIATV